MVILLEEVNATMTQLKRYWAKTRESGDPTESPAVDALAEILFMGRQIRLHVLLVAQSATARAIGGPEMRECFSTRILVRYTLNAWRMLVPEVSPIPMPTQHHGRVQVVVRGRAHETQVLNLTNAEARESMAGALTRDKVGPALQTATIVDAPSAPGPDPDFLTDAWRTKRSGTTCRNSRSPPCRGHAPTIPTSHPRSTSAAPNSSTGPVTSRSGDATGRGAPPEQPTSPDPLTHHGPPGSQLWHPQAGGGTRCAMTGRAPCRRSAPLPDRSRGNDAANLV